MDRSIETIHAERDACRAQLTQSVADYVANETPDGLATIKLGMRRLQRLYQEASDTRSRMNRKERAIDKGTRVRNVYMTPQTYETLYHYGDGNLSAGVRLAADLVRLCAPTQH